MELPSDVQYKLCEALEAYRVKCHAEAALARVLTAESKDRRRMAEKFEPLMDTCMKIHGLLAPSLDKLEPVIKAQMEALVEQAINPLFEEDDALKSTCVVCFIAEVTGTDNVCATCEANGA